MSDISVSMTPSDTKSYPLHKHNSWEIMYYLSGEGYMRSDAGDIPFSKGTIIIMPPKMIHGSVSGGGFVNISIGGDFSHLFMFEKPLCLLDNEREDGGALASLIYNNRYANKGYLSSLCAAFAGFILQNSEHEKGINRCVADVISVIDKEFSNPELDVTAKLLKSGYAEDYIRAEFKRITSYTPIGFLTKVRIDHAKSLIEIYGKSLTVGEVALASGFCDFAYFSRQFKRFVGISPKRYKEQIAANI